MIWLFCDWKIKGGNSTNMKDNNKNNKYLKTVLTVLFLLLVVTLLITQFKKIFQAVADGNNRKADVNKDELPNSPEFYKNLATALHTDMDGVDWTGGTHMFDNLVENLEILNALTDNEFKHVYNLFNRKVKNNESLKTWLQAEYLPLHSIDGDVIQRMTDLSLF